MVNYRLQIQIHEASPSDTATIFHAGILWDKETHPWLDLATVTIMTPISPDVLERYGILSLSNCCFMAPPLTCRLYTLLYTALSNYILHIRYAF